MRLSRYALASAVLLTGVLEYLAVRANPLSGWTAVVLTIALVILTLTSAEGPHHV